MFKKIIFMIEFSNQAEYLNLARIIQSSLDYFEPNNSSGKFLSLDFVLLKTEFSDSYILIHFRPRKKKDQWSVEN